MVLEKNDQGVNGKGEKKLLTISEFRREIGLPLVFTKKLISWGLVGAYLATDGTLRIAEEEIHKTRELLKNPWKKLKLFARSLGPGFVTGASDDDPSGIATYSAVGAKFGFSLLWMCLWTTPMMLAIQETCARIGVVTNRGLAGVLQKHYSKNIVISVVALLIVANTVNIGADIGAMAAAFRLLVDVNFFLTAAIFTVLIVIIEVFVPYYAYVNVLKWLTIFVFAYIATGIIIHPDWSAIFRETFSPELRFDKDYIFAIVAFLGTTITPYLFFWQTSEEVEENKLEFGENCQLTPYKQTQRIARMRTDVKTGMILSNLVALFIVLTTASVLFKHGITNVESAEQAAEALRPLAGEYAYLLFALGIIGTGLLAVPILAGAGAYALSEVMNWREGLGRKFSQARSFYVVIILSIIAGMALNFIGINPIVALYYTAFLNGVIAVPLLFVIMIVGNDAKIMGRETHPKWVKFFGWMTVASMTVAIILTFALSAVK
jgi:NRAMP (natural resistance-associated macrophage protein)-like metal ion transporter